jgi:pimeloyl-ACP methyl ester carboxylesterase
MTTNSLPSHEFGNLDAHTIILLHPGGALHSVWRPFIKNWSHKYHFFAVDLITHQTTLHELANQVANFVESKGKGKVWLMGASLGANVALLTAVKIPHRIAGLVLDSAQCGGKPPTGLPLVVSFVKKAVFFVPKFLITSLLLKQFQKYCEDDFQAIRSEIEANPKTTFLEQIELHFDYDIKPFLKDISMPTLILAGENDMLTKSGEPDKLQEGIKSSRVQIIPNAGHVTFLHQPEKFEKIVDDFLNQNAT